jgi:hypothetical protein
MSLDAVLSKDPATWERWGEKCIVADIDASFVTVLPRNAEHSNNRVRVALPRTHPDAAKIAAALKTCVQRFEASADLNGGCPADSLFVPVLVAEDGGIGITFNVNRRKLERGELGALQIKLPNDECVPGRSIDLDDGQGVIHNVEELLDMQKPDGAIYRIKFMVSKWCLSDGGQKKAGFSIGLAGRRDGEAYGLMLFNADKEKPKFLSGDGMAAVRASVDAVTRAWEGSSKRSGFDVSRLAAIAAVAQSVAAEDADGVKATPEVGIVSNLCRVDGQLAAKLPKFLLTPAKFGELDKPPTRGSYNEQNSCVTAWIHAQRGGNTQWFLHDLTGVCLRSRREEVRFPWALKITLPDGDPHARACKQNVMRLYNKALDAIPDNIVCLMGPDLPQQQADAVQDFHRKRGQIRDKALLQAIDDPDMPELAPANEDEISEFLPIATRNDERQISVSIEDDTALFWHGLGGLPDPIKSMDDIADGQGHKFVTVKRAVLQMRLNIKTGFRSKKTRSLLGMREARLIMKAVALELAPSEGGGRPLDDGDQPLPKRLCF